MAKRGNKLHWPAGIPIGGEFAPKDMCGIVRGEPLTNDIDSYIDNEYFDSCNEQDQDKRVKNINNALYDGGYILEKGDSLCGFGSAYEAEGFIIDICSHKEERKAWIGHKDLVENYVNVARGYLSRNDFDWVKDGHYTRGGERRAQELTDELGWTRKEVRQTLLNCLSADDFVNSGKNLSKDVYNQGTVVMVFSPRIQVLADAYDEKTKRTKKRRKTIDLYVKMVLNPHPNPHRHQGEFQVISFREAEGKDVGRDDDKVCLFTGKERKSRREWKMEKYANHKDHPLREIKQNRRKFDEKKKQK